MDPYPLPLEDKNLSVILDAMLDGVYVVNVDGEILYANPQMLKEFGPICKRKCYEYLHHITDRCAECRLDEVISGKTFLWEWFCPGNGKTYELFDTPLHFKDGSVSKLEMFHDITSNKRAEIEIKQRNKELLTLHTISAAVSSSLELDALLEILKTALVDELEIPAGAIYYYNQAEDILQLAESWNLQEPRRESDGNASICDDLNRQIIREKKAVLEVLTSGNRNGMMTGLLAGLKSTVQPWENRVRIPLLAQNEVQGVLELYNCAASGNAPDQMRFFNSLGHTVGVALHNAQQYGAESRLRRTAETLRAAGAALTKTFDLNELANTSLDYLAQLIPFDKGAIRLLGDSDAAEAAKLFLYSKQLGDNSPAAKDSLVIIGDGIYHPVIEQVLSEHTSLLLTAARSMEKDLAPLDLSGARLVIPLLAGGTVIGLCELVKFDTSGYSLEQVRPAESLLSQAGAAIQTALLVNELNSSRERLQSLSRRLVEVQESERRFISRELHDEAGQALTFLKLRLSILEKEDDSAAAARANIAELKSWVDDISKKLHRLAGDLRPSSLDHSGLEAALEQLTRQYQEETGLLIEFHAIGLTHERLPAELETAVYRIIQESLTNVVRHSHASRVDILIKYRDGWFMALVEDNGIGFIDENKETNGRLGLLGMQERAQMLGGSLNIETMQGVGTTVFLEFPNVQLDPNTDC